MKTNQSRYTSLLAVCLLAVLYLGACKKNKPEPTPDTPVTPVVPTGTLMMHLHIYIESTEADAYNVVYTNDNGRKISLSISQLYLSGFQLVEADGDVYNITDVKHLKVLDTETYMLGNVPVGNYTSVRFKVGLDAATNAADPSTNAILNHPEMWFGPTAQPDGYVFFNLQGKIDTTADASGTTAQMQNFSYKIGTAAHYQQVNMPPQNFTITKDAVEYLHLYADCNKIFNGIQLNQSSNLSVNTGADNASPLSNTIASNISNMFVYE